MAFSLSREELERRLGGSCPMPSAGTLTVHTDTTDFFAIDCGHVILIDGHAFLVRHNVKEGRFGLDDEVKFWVKRATDLHDESQKIIKIPFYERFDAHIGGVTFECFRSPKKEARILELVKDHPNFMHGYSLTDEKGNVVRIIEYIFGSTLPQYVEDLPMDHETYFHENLPGILDGFIECVEAIAFLHSHMEKHGDIRRDHIIMDRDTGRYRWIDFDYNYRHRENMASYDLFGLGNVLAHIVGKGDVTVQELKSERPEIFDTLWGEDLNIVFRNRVVNLKKIYPYLPDSLNDILLHFSRGARYYYENSEQLLDDLRRARQELGA